MEQLHVPAKIIELAMTCIMATRSHTVTDDSDVNYFTDADLSVLGQAPAIYDAYSSNVRKEYKMYPDAIYRPARKKVLSGFLQMSRIFKTGFFYEKYERQARVNIGVEISMIDNNDLL